MVPRITSFVIPRPVLGWVIVAAVLATAAVITTLVWTDLKRAENRFARRAQGYYHAVDRRLAGSETALASIVALDEAVDQMDQKKLARYAARLRQAHPHVRSVLYIASVPQELARAFETRMGRERGAPFRIHRQGLPTPEDMAGDAPDAVHFPIVFQAPSVPESRTIGFDLAARPELVSAIRSAIASDKRVASSIITLRSGNKGYWLFQPLMPRPSRSDRLRLAALVIELDEVVGFMRPLEPAIQVGIHDRRREGSQPLYRAGELSGAGLLPQLEFRRPLSTDSQPFELVVQQRLGWVALRWHVLVGVLASCLLAAALGLLLINQWYRSAQAGRIAHEALLRERERAEVTLYSIDDAVITADPSGAIEFMNPVAERLTGWPAEQAKGRAATDVLHLVDEATGEAMVEPVKRSLQRGESIKFYDEINLINRNGRRTAVTGSVGPIRDSQGGVTGAAMVLQDVGRDREMSHLLAYQATHDDLTGLINRREFSKRVQRVLEASRDDGRGSVLAHLDLDRFKVVNDTSGHLAGDAMLKQIARLLQPHVREEDTLARVGGDEFGILFEECELDEAIKAVEEMIEVVKRFRFNWEEKSFEVGASVGLIELKPEHQTLAEVMNSADAACYIAKERGGNRVHVYQADDDALLKRQGELEWLHRITHAYSDNRFVLFAQEIVPLQNTPSDDRHYEVLLRMMDDSGSLVLPMEYIAAAERYNMMFDLDRWVLLNAFRVIRPYVEKFDSNSEMPMKRFAINLSGQSLSDDRTMDYVRTEFEATPSLPKHVVFEITETAAVSNLTQAESFISEFREMGCRFSLDDFGSGVSSFAHLKDLHVDYLKIDGKFVRDMEFDPVNFVMVGSINHIGHVMGIKTIAEYVESGEILEKVRELGVDFAQGSWIGAAERLEQVI